MQDRIRKTVYFLFRFGLSATLLIYIINIIDWQGTSSAIKSADLKYIGFAVLVFLMINFFILLRWNIFIRSLELQAEQVNIIRFFFIGLFGNLFLPSSIGGDVIKILGLCRDSNEKPKVVASVLLDRISGFGGIVLFAVVSYAFGYSYLDDISILVAIITMGVLFITIGLFLFDERLYRFACLIFYPFPRIKSALMNMHYDIVLLKNRGATLIIALSISAFCQFLLSIIFYLISLALHQDIAFIYFIIFVPLISVASAFPSIGGLGVREAGAAYLFTKVGMASGIAVSISLINYIFMVGIGLIGGIIYVVSMSSGQIPSGQANTNT